MPNEAASPCFGAKPLLFFSVTAEVKGGTWRGTEEWREGKFSRSGGSDISSAFRRHLSLQDLPAALAFPETGHTLSK